MRNHKSMHKATFWNPLKYIFLYNNLSSIRFVRWKITNGLEDFVKICSIIPKWHFVVKTQQSIVLRSYNNLSCWKKVIKVLEGRNLTLGAPSIVWDRLFKTFKLPKVFVKKTWKYYLMALFKLSASYNNKYFIFDYS